MAWHLGRVDRRKANPSRTTAERVAINDLGIGAAHAQRERDGAWGNRHTSKRCDGEFATPVRTDQPKHAADEQTGGNQPANIPGFGSTASSKRNDLV